MASLVGAPDPVKGSGTSLLGISTIMAKPVRFSTIGRTSSHLVAPSSVRTLSRSWRLPQLEAESRGDQGRGRALTWAREETQRRRNSTVYAEGSKCQGKLKASSVKLKSVECDRVAEQLLIGPCPRDAEEVKALQEMAGADAIICLQPSEDLSARGVSWAAVVESAESLEMQTLQLPMKEFDAASQAGLLLDALAVVEFLMGIGCNVYVCCASGDLVSPLVALGHLTLSKGLSFETAKKHLLEARPSSKPLRAAWDRVIAVLTEGTSARQKELAHIEFRRRLLTREQGTHTKDCQVALEQVAVESFRRKVSLHKGLADQMSKAVVWEAKKTQEQVVEDLQGAVKTANARAQAAEAASTAASERIKFFFRQLASVKEKEGESKSKAKSLERTVGALEKQLKEAEKERQQLQQEMNEKEAQTQKAMDHIRAASDKGGVLLSPEQLEQVKRLQASLSEIQKSLQAADDRNSFLVRQLAVSRESELRAKTAARAADTRYTKILKQVEDLARREAAARKAASNAVEKYRAVNAELVDLGCAKEGPEAVMEIRARLEDLTKQVADLKVREEAAEAATAEAVAKLAEVVQKLEKAEEREKEMLMSERASSERAQELELRLDALQTELAEAKLAASSAGQMVTQMSAEVVELREREAAADEAVKRYEALRGQLEDLEQRDAAYKDEIAAATQRIAALSELISTLSTREMEMCEALGEANDKIEFLSERVGELVQREEVARAAAESAEEQVEELNQQVGIMGAAQEAAVQQTEVYKVLLEDTEERERQALEAASLANSKVQELFAKVAEVESREKAAKAAADDAYRRLEEMAGAMQLNFQGIDPSVQEEEEEEEEQEVTATSSAEGERADGAVQAEASPPKGAVPWLDVLVFNKWGGGDKEPQLVPVKTQGSQGSGRNQVAPPKQVVPSVPAPAAPAVPAVPAAPAAAAPNGTPSAASARNAAEAAELAEKRKVLGATLDECVGLFVSQVSALKEREVASRDALTAANKRIEALSGQVSVLAKREEAANALAEEFASQVTELVTRITELNDELESAEKREAELAEALTASAGSGGDSSQDGNGRLALAPKKEAKVLVAELDVARQRADELAAEVEEARKMAEEISESIFGARRRSLQEQQQREELVAEVVALKEAMVLMRERETAITTWKEQLLEQADYLASLMDEGDVNMSTREQLQASVLDIRVPV